MPVVKIDDFTPKTFFILTCIITKLLVCVVMTWAALLVVCLSVPYKSHNHSSFYVIDLDFEIDSEIRKSAKRHQYSYI